MLESRIIIDTSSAAHATTTMNDSMDYSERQLMEDDSTMYCSYSRLVTVVECIQDATICTKNVLSLIQIPAAETIMTSNNIYQSNHANNANITESPVQRLINLANKMSSFVSVALRESLAEVIKANQIKFLVKFL